MLCVFLWLEAINFKCLFLYGFTYVFKCSLFFLILSSSSQRSPSPGPNHTSSTSASNSTPAPQNTSVRPTCSLTPTLAAHFNENLIKHVQGWPADHAEKQVSTLVLLFYGRVQNV